MWVSFYISTMRQIFFFSFVVFITAILAGPILTGIILSLTDPLVYQISDIFDGLKYGVPLGILLCVPSWLLLSIAIRLVAKPGMSVIRVKFFACLAAAPLIILPFGILNFNELFNKFFWTSSVFQFLSYYLITLISIWSYKLKLPMVQTEV
ncbi:MAG TPA: hypothetical protein VL525_03465 [Mucilaginibacter sp.]|nr:hypothetical protein [Mucilaginibacter sp.]